MAYIKLNKDNQMKKLLSATVILLVLMGCNIPLNIDTQGNNFLDSFYRDEQEEPAPEPPFIPPSLTIKGLPLNIITGNFSNIFIYNAVGKVAQCLNTQDIIIINNDDSATAVIPLVYTEDKSRYFYENGFFSISFTVTVDALTQIIRNQYDNIVIKFINGCGTHDINDEPAPEPEPLFIPPSLTIKGLPLNIITGNFSNVYIYNALGRVAQCSSIDEIIITNNDNTSTAVIPLVYTGDTGRYFYENGYFAISFTVTVDMLTQITRNQSDNIIIQFNNGCGTHDINDEPAPEPEPLFIPPSLTIKGLPKNIITSNFTNVYIYNAQGRVAQCSNIQDIVIIQNTNSADAVIPLVYTGDTGRYFYESGYFAISFTVTVDMLTQIIRNQSDNIIIQFNDGCGTHDINDEPIPEPEPLFIPPSLTIKGLPENIITNNFSNIYVFNAQGRVAQCSNIQDIVIIQNTNSADAVIPLVYTGDTSKYFYENGYFTISFTVTVDMLTQIIREQADSILVQFSNGCGTHDIAKEPVPQPEPPFIPPALTIKGLPQNIIQSNFSNVYIYNILGKVAQCSNNQDIVITRGANSATAAIPLVYTSDTSEYFYENGEFAVSFTVTVDMLTQIIRSQSDNIIIKFLNGFSTYDAANEPIIKPEPVRRNWTFMIYMAADNDLESAAIADINELEAVKLSNAPISILTLIDRHPGYDMTNGNWSDTRIYEIKNDPNGLNSNIVSTRLDCPELGLYTNIETELNTADPLVLSRFIDFAKREYPADNYALFIWGHGTGWRGGYQSDNLPMPLKAVAFDDTNGQYMPLPAFGRTITGKGLSVIAFDTCYAALLEVAYQIKNDAELFVGSTGPILSTGWDYTALFTNFLQKPNLSANDLGNSIQYQFSLQYAFLNNAAISQIKLSQVNNLFEKFDAFAGAVAEAISNESARNIVRNQILNNIESYYFTSFPSDLYIDISDFRQKINNIRTSITTDTVMRNEILAASNNLDSALASAIISSWASNGTTKKIGVHVISLENVGVPSTSHELAYIKGSMYIDKSSFVNNSQHWVPNAVPKSGSLLDKLFYWMF